LSGALSFTKSILKVKGDSGVSSAGLASYVWRAVTGFEKGVESMPMIVTEVESSIPSVSICVPPGHLVYMNPVLPVPILVNCSAAVPNAGFHCVQ
jgi:hypothetical protein